MRQSKQISYWVLTPLWLLVLFTTSNAQQPKYYQQWFFGDSVGLDFRQNPVQKANSALYSAEGSASICDPVTGNVLFYTNGEQVWNRMDQVMPNGSGLFGHESSTQSSVIVPLPGSNRLYYLFTSDAGPYEPRMAGVHYSIVDIQADNGLGDVITKNVPLLAPAAEKLVGIRHCNGTDFWVVGHELWTNRFVSWKVTASGITDTVYSAIGTVLDSTLSDKPSIGYLKASPNGHYLFAVYYKASVGELFRFDNGSGVVFDVIAELPAFYGASFSPNNRYLYTMSNGGMLERYVPDPPNNTTVESTREVVGRLFGALSVGRGMRGMQLGPDGRIYVAINRFSRDSQVNSVGVVENPNLSSAFLRDSAFVYGNAPAYNVINGLPNCIDGFLGDFDGAGQGKQYLLTAEDTVICVGQETRLEVQGGLRYEWLPAEGLLCDSCTDTQVTVEPKKTTTYSVVVHGFNSCQKVDTLRVVVRVADIEADAGPDTAICVGSSLQLRASEGVAYQWSPSEGLSCDDCRDPVVSLSKTTTYHVRVTNEVGCTSTDSVVLTLIDESLLRIAPRDTVLGCGESLTLQAPGGKEYRWFPVATLSCADCPEPIATPTERTTYYLDVVDSSGCSVLDSITVDVLYKEMQTTKDTAICFGQAVRILATGRKSYQWRPSEGLSCDDCPNPVATPQQTTTYIVEGSTNGLCVAVDTVTVTVHELPIADAGADTKICLGDSVQLQASGGVDYFWTSSTLSGVHRPDPIAFPITTTTYHVRVTNAFGCIAWDSVTVTVENNGSVLATGDTAFCAGGTAQLFAEGAASYRWTPTIGLSCEDCPDPQATPTETTTYYVLGSNTNGGCPALDSVTVVVHDFPIAEAGEGGAVCSGESIELKASGGVRYRWDTSVDLSCEDCPDPHATPTETRTYYVTVWNAEGCSSRDSVEVVVHPGLVVVTGEVKSICSGKSVELQAEGGVRWEWSPGEGLSCTDCPNPEAMPSTTTMYRVRAWNAEGCEAEDSVEVQVREEVEVVRMRISRDHHGGTGEELVIPIEVVDDFGETDISELELRLTYDPAIMRLDKESFARLLVGTALEGWSVEVVAFTHGEASVRLVAPEGEVLTASSPLLRFAARLYLSNVRGTELAFSITSNSTCFAIETEPGYAELDSICGLSFRLIESTLTKYVAPVAYPNPASDRMQFEFGLGLDGRAVLEVFDMQGRRVGLLVDSELASGQYSVEWDVRDVGSGQYWYRLTSGDWIKSGQVRVQK